MNVLPNELNLPLFLLSRTRYRGEQRAEVRNLLTQQIRRRSPSCRTVEAESSVDVVTDKSPPAVPCRKPIISNKKAPCSWKLPPNYYDPYESSNEARGVSWAVSARKTKSRLPAATEPIRRYKRSHDRKPKRTKSSDSLHQRHSSHIRSWRAPKIVHRNTFFNILTGCHGPGLPSTADLYPRNYDIAYNVSPKKKTPQYNPYKFLPHSCVPATPYAFYGKHSSFEPGPGRYDTRYMPACPCDSMKPVIPRLKKFLERQARLKLRHSPYLNVERRTYQDKDLAHVKGKGFHHLFMNAPPRKSSQPKKLKKASLSSFYKVPNRELISNTERKKISFRDDVMPSLPPDIRYNCLLKNKPRYKNWDKNPPFGSSAPRWKDDDFSKSIFSAQLASIKALLSRDLEMRKVRVTHKPFEDIKCLYHKPTQIKNFKYPTRKPVFRFSPIPEPKMLDAKESAELNAIVSGNFFETRIDYRKYLKDNVEMSKISKPSIVLK